MPRGSVKVPAPIRFREQFLRTTGGCWLWIGALDGDGYGQFTDETGSNTRAHRYSWTLHKGDIPTGIKVLHKCDTPPCVNPAHLFLGTDADNLADAVQKGRLKLKGEDNPAAKLTEQDVRDIRQMIRRGVKYREIAASKGVCTYIIDSIKSGKLWSHVKD